MNNITIEQVKQQIKNGNASYENKTKVLEFLDGLINSNNYDNMTLRTTIDTLEDVNKNLIRERDNLKRDIEIANNVNINNLKVYKEVAKERDNLQKELVALDYDYDRDTKKLTGDRDAWKAISNTTIESNDNLRKEIVQLKEKLANCINSNVKGKTTAYTVLFNKNDELIKENLKLKERLGGNSYITYDMLIEQVDILNDKLTKITKERDNLKKDLNSILTNQQYTSSLEVIGKERDSYKAKYNTILTVMKGFGIYTMVTDAITE